MADLIITEGISGLWHYHLSPVDRPQPALCGATVMRSGVALKDWGVPFGDHFPKRPTWCSKCAARKPGATPHG